MDATTTRDEREQGRAALMHGEPEAQIHLGRAYQRGDHSPGTKFIYSRALQPKQYLREIGDPVDAVAFSPDGDLVVAGSRDGAEQVWHAGSGEILSRYTPRHSKILAVEFDRTSKLVLAAGADGTVVVADAALGMAVTVLEGPQNAVRVAHFDPSSSRVVGASLDGTARVWDATSPYLRWSSPPVSDDCGIGTSAEPDGRFIAVGCRTYPTRVWDTARDQLLAELPSVSHVEGNFTSAPPAVSAAGDRAAIARGNMVEVYEIPGGRLLRTITHAAPVNAVAFASTALAASDQECMTANEVAAYLRINRKSVYEYAGSGVIPCRRIGRRLVFSRSAIVAWLTRQTAPLVPGGVR